MSGQVDWFIQMVTIQTKSSELFQRRNPFKRNTFPQYGQTRLNIDFASLRDSLRQTVGYCNQSDINGLTWHDSDDMIWSDNVPYYIILLFLTPDDFTRRGESAATIVYGLIYPVNL